MAIPGTHPSPSDPQRPGARVIPFGGSERLHHRLLSPSPIWRFGAALGGRRNAVASAESAYHAGGGRVPYTTVNG